MNDRPSVKTSALVKQLEKLGAKVTKVSDRQWHMMAADGAPYAFWYYHKRHRFLWRKIGKPRSEDITGETPEGLLEDIRLRILEVHERVEARPTLSLKNKAPQSVERGGPVDTSTGVGVVSSVSDQSRRENRIVPPPSRSNQTQPLQYGRP